MKSKGLLNLITFSDVRKGVFLLLADGPMTLSELKLHLDLRSPEIIPRIKDLTESGLVCKTGDKYHLTPMGEIIAEKFKPLASMTEMIDRNEAYFSRYKIEAIPRTFVERLGELGECHVIENTRENISAVYREAINNIARSKRVAGVSPIFENSFPGFFTSMARNHIPVSFVLTEGIYEKVRLEYSDYLEEYLGYDNAEMYVLKDEPGIAFTVTDCFLTISLVNRSGQFDLHSTLASYEKPAVRWGQDLFEYYKKKARVIKL